MKINVEKNNETLNVALEGRLDTTTAPDLEKVINEQTEGVKKVNLDMKQLEYISSAGLRVLLATHKKMGGEEGFKVTGVCDTVMEVFEITGFADILNIE